jgi:Zn-finger nucleic acid-binding protein
VPRGLIEAAAGASHPASDVTDWAVIALLMAARSSTEKTDVSPSDAVTLKCPNCGAPSRSGASRCEYCLARLATVSCPSCFGLGFDGAAYCEHCGVARSRVETAGGDVTKCPACRARMKWLRVGTTDLLECERCEGTWVEAAAFERVCTDRESQAAILHGSSGPSPAAAGLDHVRYRPCPRCGKLMNRVNFARSSGAVVDVCKGHGTFLDRGELHQIVRFVQSGGVDRARAAEREAIREEQRRLRDLEWEQARAMAASSSAKWNDSSVRDLLDALF